MFFQILLLYFTHLMLPAIFLFWLWRGRFKSRLDWLATFLLTGGFVLYVFATGRWDWISYFVRYLWPVLFLAAGLVSFFKQKHAHFGPPPSAAHRMNTWLLGLLAAVFLVFDALVFQGFRYSEAPVRLIFPLRHGVYYIGQGGASRLINYHTVSRAQRYALDIVKLNSRGRRASGIYPSRLAQYAIFADTVYCPCAGLVTETENGLEDLAPPNVDTASFRANRNNIAGNRVVLLCDSVRVLLAHLRQNSVLVQAGDRVRAGQPVGQVGNTGNTSEPHLHIHAERLQTGTPILRGQGVPILFERRFLVRNDLVRRNASRD